MVDRVEQSPLDDAVGGQDHRRVVDGVAGDRDGYGQRRLAGVVSGVGFRVSCRSVGGESRVRCERNFVA